MEFAMAMTIGIHAAIVKEALIDFGVVRID